MCIDALQYEAMSPPPSICASTFMAGGVTGGDGMSSDAGGIAGGDGTTGGAGATRSG